MPVVFGDDIHVIAKPAGYFVNTGTGLDMETRKGTPAIVERHIYSSGADIILETAFKIKSVPMSDSYPLPWGDHVRIRKSVPGEKIAELIG